MLASDSGEIDRARFRLNLGVTRGLENRETVERETLSKITSRLLPSCRGVGGAETCCTRDCCGMFRSQQQCTDQLPWEVSSPLGAE